MKTYGRRLTNRLSAASIKAKPGPKIQDRRDGNGLILRTHPNGRKQWIWRGTVRGTGKETMFGLGSPDIVTLAEARAIAIDYTRCARQGRDPRNSRVASITAGGTHPVRGGRGPLLERDVAGWHRSCIFDDHWNERSVGNDPRIPPRRPPGALPPPHRRPRPGGQRALRRPGRR